MVVERKLLLRNGLIRGRGCSGGENLNGWGLTISGAGDKKGGEHVEALEMGMGRGLVESHGGDAGGKVVGNVRGIRRRGEVDWVLKVKMQ